MQQERGATQLLLPFDLVHCNAIAPLYLKLWAIISLFQTFGGIYFFFFTPNSNLGAMIHYMALF